MIMIAACVRETSLTPVTSGPSQMSDVWFARQAVAAGCHASTIRKYMTGRPGAVTRGG